MRDKWDARRGASTYGRITIDKAIALTDEPYTPPSDPDNLTGSWKHQKHAEPGSPNGQGAPGAATSAAPTPETLLPVLPFPVEVLPPAFRALVEQGAASIVAPPDFLATPLIVAAGAAIGNALEIQLKTGWREGANLFAAIVGEPGTKKTPMENAALGPIYSIQTRLDQEFEELDEAYKKDLAAWEERKKGDRGEKPEPPVFEHVLTTDATTEAVAAMLKTAKGVLLNKDELVGWVRSMDQYRAGGKGADRQHYLSMWSRKMIKVDRKGSPRPIVVARPHLSVSGGIQPDLLPDLADAAQREDGFLDRLLWSYPDPVPDRWTLDVLPFDVIQRVEKVFDRLYALEGEMNDFGKSTPRVVRLSPDAAGLWAEWYAEHARENEAESFPKHLRGPWAKMPAQLARLALILHALRHEDPASLPLEEETLAAAADMVLYFKNHAKRAYRHLARQRRDSLVMIMAALRARGPMTQSQIQAGIFRNNVSAERLRGWLDSLEEAGLATREERKPANPEKGGRPATVWQLVA